MIKFNGTAKRTFYGLMVTILTISACSKNEEPQKRLNEKEMENVLYQIHLTDASLDYVPSLDSLLIKAKSKYTFIFRENEIDSAAFSDNLKFYVENQPKKLINIYDRVLKRLEELKVKEQPLTYRKKRVIPSEYRYKNHTIKVDTIGLLLTERIKKADSLRNQQEIAFGIDF